MQLSHYDAGGDADLPCERSNRSFRNALVGSELPPGDRWNKELSGKPVGFVLFAVILSCLNKNLPLFGFEDMTGLVKEREPEMIVCLILQTKLN